MAKSRDEFMLMKINRIQELEIILSQAPFYNDKKIWPSGIQENSAHEPSTFDSGN